MKIRVHFTATSPTGGKVTSTIDVEADSEDIAAKLAENKWRSTHSSQSDYSFAVTKFGVP